MKVVWRLLEEVAQFIRTIAKTRPTLNSAKLVDQNSVITGLWTFKRVGQRYKPN